MKNRFNLLFEGSVLLIIATVLICSFSNNIFSFETEESNSEKIATLYQQIQDVAIKENQRIVYNTLSKAEKKDLWNYKLNLVDTKKFSAAQLEVYLELLDLSTIIVEDYSMEKLEKIDKAWRVKALDHFSAEEVYTMAYSFTGAKALAAKPSLGNCDCKWYCPEGNKCAQDTGCDPVGCGIFWLLRCSGLCPVEAGVN